MDTTFEEQLERMRTYITSEKKTLSGRVKKPSINTVTSKMENIKSCVKHIGWCDFTQDWINRLVRKLSEKKANGTDYSTSTQMVYLYAVRDFYDANGHPGMSYAIPDVVQKEATWHSRAEIEKMIRASGCVRDTALLTLLYFAALRNVEVRSLFVVDVDTINGVVHVRDHGDGTLKSKCERDIPIPIKCLPVIEKWKKERREIDVPSKTLFINQNGKQFTREGITLLVERTGRRVGIETHPHAWRHSRASYLLNEGRMGIHKVRRILGHRSLNTTQRYSHVDLNTITRDINEIGD